MTAEEQQGHSASPRPAAQAPAGANPADAAPAADAQALQDEIEQTRQQLGETVEELVAKTDVKARARERAAALSGQARERAAVLSGQARERAAALSGQARDVVAKGAGAARQHRVPLAAALAVAVIAGYLAVRWRSKK